MRFSKLVETIKFYYGFIISGFANGGSWKIEKITELNSMEIRKILVRNKSTYDEIFGCRQRLSQ
jgi:hypothetical protein